MDNPIQTSFIPKETTLAARPRREREPRGLLTTIASVLLLVSGLFWVAAFGYKQFLNTQITNLKATIDQERQSLQPELLAALERTAAKLVEGQKVVSSHTSVNRFFKLLNDITLKNIRYTNFEFKGAEVKAKGLARGYEDVAVQAKILAANKDSLSSFNFGDFNLDQNGNVVFSLTLAVAPGLLRYQPLATAPAAAATSSQNQATSSAKQSQPNQ